MTTKSKTQTPQKHFNEGNGSSESRRLLSEEISKSKTQEELVTITEKDFLEMCNYKYIFTEDYIAKRIKQGRQDALNEVLEIISYNLEYYKGHLKDLTNSPETSSTLNSWINEDLHLKKQIEELK